MKKENTKYIGIDIGGAHIKCVGIDKFKNISYTKYESYQIWNDKKVLLEKLNQINKEVNNNKLTYGITMSAELCDNFPNRKRGVKYIIEACNSLKSKKLFYSNKSLLFSSKSKIEHLMSMNWHAIGKLCENKVKDSIIVDFGSTTTDFLCIKNFKLRNKGFSDFERINNNELIYKGLIRTPLFGIKKKVKFKKKYYNLIPEIFSDMADVYRVIKLLKKDIDVDKTADASSKSIRSSMIRIARNFGLDYNNSKKELILKICNELYYSQLNEIKNNIDFLRKKYKISSKCKIVLSGIGQEVLMNYLNRKFNNTIFLFELLGSKKYKKASYHAPALSIALLLFEKN